MSEYGGKLTIDDYRIAMKSACSVIERLEARVKELETENTDMREQIEHHCLNDCCCDWCIEQVVRQEASHD